MKKTLFVLIMMLCCIGVNAQRTSVETIYGYLRVFPEELGSFESVPNTVINQLNSQAIYGYNTWRIPTNEELSLMKAKGYLSGGTYMTKENTRGIVLLVTDKADAATLKAEYARTHGSSNGYDWVDLGLSVKWATCNVGASKPEDYGNYYAWGETSTKSSYTIDNSKTYGKSMGDISGNSSYDAARANWGGNWRMPTKTEMQELIDKCKWEWVIVKDVNGYNVECYKVTGPNGNSIFLPATGERDGSSLYFAGSGGYYWGSAPYKSNADGAYSLFFNSDYLHLDYFSRYLGCCIRPVSE